MTGLVTDTGEKSNPSEQASIDVLLFSVTNPEMLTEH